LDYDDELCLKFGFPYPLAASEEDDDEEVSFLVHGAYFCLDVAMYGIH